MRLPVATTDTTPGGFTWTNEGELVMVAFTCDRDRKDPNLECGCGRAFAGLRSRKATTRAIVCELPMDLHRLRAEVKDCLSVGGWINKAEPMTDDDAELVAEVCAEMVEIGEMFEEGTLLARHLDDVFPVNDASSVVG